MGSTNGKLEQIGELGMIQSSIESLANWFKDQSETLKDNQRAKAASELSSELSKMYEKARKNFEKGKYEKSLSQYQMLLCIHEVNNPNYISIGELQHEIGLVNMALGKYEDALINLKKSLEVYQKTLPNKHPYLVILLAKIGFVYAKLEEYNQAFEFYYRSLKMLKQISPKNQNEVFMGQLMNSIALVFYEIGEYEKALKYLNEAKARLNPSNFAQYPRLLNNIGLVLFKLDKYDQGMESLNESVRIQKESSSSKGSQLALTYKIMGKACLERGENHQAEEYFRKALSLK